MDPVTLGMAKADAAKKYESVGRRGATIPGYLVADNVYATAGPSAKTATGTSRCPHTIAVECADIRLTYANWYNNGNSVSPNYCDVDNASAITIKAAVEYGGVIYPVTFNGLRSVTIDGGGYVTSDPIPLDLPAGALVYSRTYISASNWYANKNASQSTGAGGWVATSDLTAAGSGAVADGFASLYVPMAITGTPSVGSPSATVAVIGDSIAHGIGDGGNFAGYNTLFPYLSGGGFCQRALRGNRGYVTTAVSGDSATGFLANTGHFRRLTFVGACSNAIIEYGRNDLTAGRTLAQIQADLIAVWQLARRRGMRVFQTTITPNVATNTGGYLDGTQVHHANAANATRISLNAWIRAGAPVNVSLVAVANGTEGAIYAGNPAHPLYGYFEVTDLVETARDSGIWKYQNVRTVTDAAMTSGSGTLTSATANFTTADLGRTVSIVGAGAAGANLNALISARSSATQVTLATSAGTTVSGATAKVGDAFTVDGLHPSPSAAAIMAGAIDLSRLAS